MSRQLRFLSLFFTLTLIARSAGPFTPNCQKTYTFSNVSGFPVDNIVTFGGPAATPAFNNGNAAGCQSWSFSYNAVGFSVLSISLQSAPLGVDAKTPGTFVTFTGTTVSGSNPSTNISNNTYNATGLLPWLRVNLASVTGTGTLTVVLYGWQDPNFGGGSGGGTIPNTSNLLIGGAGNSAGDSGIVPSNVVKNNQVNTFAAFTQSFLGDINVTGSMTSSAFVLAGVNQGFYISGKSGIQSPADGSLTLFNSTATSFGSLQFGGVTSGFPAIKRNGTAINFRLADDSADAPISGSDVTVTNQKSTTGQRYVCIDTTGKLVSSATACSGT